MPAGHFDRSTRSVASAGQRWAVGGCRLRAGPVPELAVVFTRTVPNAASTEVYRQLIRDDGVRVLSPTVGRLERYAQAYGGGTGSVAPRPPRFSGWQAAVLGRQNWCGREIPSSKRSRPAGDGPASCFWGGGAANEVRRDKKCARRR